MSRRRRFRWRHEPHLAYDRPRELIRFAGKELDPNSGQPLGIFQLAADMINNRRLPAGDHRRLTGLRAWFNANLAQPRRFSHWKDGWRNSAHGWLRRPIAISWFRSDAAQCLKYAEAMVDLLRTYGIEVERLTCTNPGYITYEDDHQVVAVPFHHRDGTGDG
ncbi:MAG: hypothetical protein H0W78_07655 [Planctomycetes bacterium]|nr:hypothetical protein [Planctomycetota bacterium]